MNVIDSFSGEFEFLSNFYPADITYEGIFYFTNEHAFQAAKTFNLIEKMAISAMETPGKAKRAGREVTLRPDWEDVKYNIMKEICYIKFGSNLSLRYNLLQTGDAELIEGNTWNDTCWGVCNGVGTNWLGQILMEIRSKLR